MGQTKSGDFFCKRMCVGSISLGGQWEGMEAKGGAGLSPGTFPDPPHALLPTHIRLQKSHWILFGPSLMDITVHENKIIFGY